MKTSLSAVRGVICLPIRAMVLRAQSAHSASLMGEKSTMAFFFFSSVYSFLRPSALPLTKNTTQAVGGIRSTYSAI